MNLKETIQITQVLSIQKMEGNHDMKPMADLMKTAIENFTKVQDNNSKYYIGKWQMIELGLEYETIEQAFTMAIISLH